MTVAIQSNRLDYTATAGQTIFPYPGPLSVAADLRVYVDESLMTYTAQYTLTGVGTAGGNVILTTPAVGGEQVILLRQVPIDQQTDYQAHDAFPALAHEAALDKLTLIAQQLKEITDRCLQLNVALSAGKSGLELPVPAAAPDGGVTSWIARWNALHTNLEIMPLATETGLVGDVIPSSTLAGLPAAGTPGRLRRVSDDVGGIWYDDGPAYVSVNGGLRVVGLKATGSAADRDYNTTALQAVIDAAPEGATLQLPMAPTTKEIHLGPITIPKSMTLKGWGQKATRLIFSATTTWGIKVEAEEVRLEGMTLDGGGNTNAGVIGLWLNGYSWHKLTDVVSTGFLGTATSLATRGCGIVKQATAFGGFFLRMLGGGAPANGIGLKFVKQVSPEVPVTYISLIDCAFNNNLTHGIYDDEVTFSFTYGLKILGGYHSYNGLEAWKLRPNQFCIIDPNLEGNGGATYQAIFTSPGGSTVFKGFVSGIGPASLNLYPGSYAVGGYYGTLGMDATPESPTSEEPATLITGNLQISGEKIFLDNDAAIGFFEGGVFKKLFGRSNTRSGVLGNTETDTSLVHLAGAGPRIDHNASGWRLGTSGTPIKQITRLTATVSAGTVAAQTTKEVAVTLTGVAVGDLVIPEPPDALEANLAAAGAVVTGAGAAELRLVNPTAAPIGAADRTWAFLWLDLT